MMCMQITSLFLERKLRRGPSPTTAVMTAQVAPVQAPSAEAVDMVDSTGWFYIS